MTSLHDFHADRLDGTDQDLAAYAGNVVLVVNTASECGLTPQYEGLQQLHEEYADQGLAVLGFPCNQFGAQEPGSATEISDFCQVNYGVEFAMFAKVDVNGPDAHPLYAWLRSERPTGKGAAPQSSGEDSAGDLEWNFTKFLVDRDGQVIERYQPTETPEALRTDIEAALAR